MSYITDMNDEISELKAENEKLKEAHAQLAEAVGLLREIETAKIIFNAEKFELNRRLVAFLARHAQGAQAGDEPK